MPSQDLVSKGGRAVVKLAGMPSYDIFGKFYDAVMGDGSEPEKRILELARVSRPGAERSSNSGAELDQY